MRQELPRICILTFSYPRFEGDDAGIFLHRLVNAYAQCGASGIVIVPHDKDEPLTETQGSFTIYRIPYGIFSRGKLAFGAGIMPNLRRNPLLFFRIPSLLFSLTSALRKHKDSYDVIHANWIPSPVIAYALNVSTKKPYIITVRGEDLKLAESPLLRPFFAPAMRCASAVTCVSEVFKRKIQGIFNLPSEVVHHIPNGTEAAAISFEVAQKRVTELGHTLSSRILLFAGSIIPRKGVQALIDALEHPALSDYVLWCCGRLDDPTYHGKLMARVKELSLESRVKFLGRVSPADIHAFLRVSRYYVTASTFEGRPNSVLEALAAKIPVIASDIPAHREVLKDGTGGILFSGVDELCKAVVVLDGDSRLVAQYIEAGSALINKNTWEETARKYLKILK